MDILTALPNGIAPVGGLVLTLVYLMRTVSRGDWIPRRFHEEAIAVREETVTVEREANAELRHALRVLAVEHGTTADKVLSALPLPEEARDDA